MDNYTEEDVKKAVADGGLLESAICNRVHETTHDDAKSKVYLSTFEEVLELDFPESVSTATSEATLAATDEALRRCKS